MALSQGIRARLEVQRVLLKEKLDQLGPNDPPSALNLDPDASPLLSVAGGAHVSQGGLGGGGRGPSVSLTTCWVWFDLVVRSEVKFHTTLVHDSSADSDGNKY